MSNSPMSPAAVIELMSGAGLPELEHLVSRLRRDRFRDPLPGWAEDEWEAALSAELSAALSLVRSHQDSIARRAALAARRDEALLRLWS